MVIPKEIRRTMRIREGDPLEIYTDKDGGVIFKKYSLMGGLGDFAGQMCETRTRPPGDRRDHRPGCLHRRGKIRPAELTDKRISSELEQIMEGRQIYQYQAGDKAVPVSDDGSKYLVACAAAPILSEGDVLGCVPLWARRRIGQQ